MVKRKKKPDADLTDEERKRREHQRAQREKALAIRAVGKAFVSTAKKRKPLERRKFEQRKAERKGENAEKRRAVQKAAKKAKASAPNVVIVPIFWKGEAKQMGRVLSACADAEAALTSSGRSVLLDGGHKYTPGQKFAHWEHKGVRLRVEIGPREAERGMCSLARVFEPGVPAHRVQNVGLSEGALQSALTRLDQMAEPTVSNGGGGGGSGDGDGGGGAAKAAASGVGDAKPVRGGGGGGGGGDDMNANFEAWGDGGDDAEAERKAKKKEKKARKEGSKGESAAAPGAKKPKKVVTF